MSEIYAMVKRPGKPVAWEIIDNSLTSLQQLVGGYIEMVTLEDRETVMVINEEGKFRSDCQPNFSWRGDIIMGTAVFVRADGDDVASLDDWSSATVYRTVMLPIKKGET